MRFVVDIPESAGLTSDEVLAALDSIKVSEAAATADDVMALVSEYGQRRWSEGSHSATHLAYFQERADREEAADLFKQIRGALDAIEQGKQAMQSGALEDCHGQVAGEVVPQCWCLTCRPLGPERMEMVVCPQCGCKRCPRAQNHEHVCTGKTGSDVPGGHACSGCEANRARFSDVAGRA